MLHIFERENSKQLDWNIKKYLYFSLSFKLHVKNYLKGFMLFCWGENIQFKPGNGEHYGRHHQKILEQEIITKTSTDL